MADLKPNDLSIGQKVWLRSANQRGRPDDRGTITKIGRKLVTIQSDSVKWDVAQYRLEGQHKNDQYRHELFVTDEQAGAQRRRKKDLETLDEHGLGLRDRYSTKVDDDFLHEVAEFLRSRGAT